MSGCHCVCLCMTAPTPLLQVNSVWHTTMEATVKNPNVLQRMVEDRILVNFQEANQRLDAILKSLNQFLETKRMAFPRFFFLSNEELLEVPLALLSCIPASSPFIAPAVLRPSPPPPSTPFLLCSAEAFRCVKYMLCRHGGGGAVAGLWTPSTVIVTH